MKKHQWEWFFFRRLLSRKLDEHLQWAISSDIVCRDVEEVKFNSPWFLLTFIILFHFHYIRLFVLAKLMHWKGFIYCRGISLLLALDLKLRLFGSLWAK